MTLRALVALGMFACFAAAQAPHCLLVESDRILAKDVAVALSAFSSIPPDMPLAYSPLPGFRHVLHSSEILSLAKRYSITVETATDVCFEWDMEPLNRDRVLDAMLAALEVPGVRVEILETSRYLVPNGRLEFTRARLGRPASPDQIGPLLWRGDVIYGGNRRHSIWATVKLSAPCDRVKATEDLRPGRPVEARQLRTDAGQCFPLPGPAFSMDQFVGMMPLRFVPAGNEIRGDWFSRPNDVNRGDLVEIEVLSGATRLALVAKAQTAGRTGEVIFLRNPVSNKTFQGRVSGKGKAIVQAGLVKGD